ncbi:diphthamide synthesis protein [Candidatus Pacearchaeota archaeon]|nr:diphthamide synthesis protein [Candidatus Pacearchaeota archaeon]
MRILFIEAKYEKPVYLTDNLRKYLKNKKTKSIALFASVQFSNLDNFIKEIEKLKIKVNITKAKRTSSVLQILGCDCYKDTFKVPIIEQSDLILYVGDGLFHPKALLLSQIKNEKIKPVIIYNPIAKDIRELTEKDIEQQLKKMKANLRKYLNAEKIGILVSIKPGQQYLALAKKLKEQLVKEGKKPYIFVDNTFDLNALENYPFIQCWVNTACPRIGTDDIINIEQPMINIREAFDPVKELEEFQ